MLCRMGNSLFSYLSMIMTAGRYGYALYIHRIVIG